MKHSKNYSKSTSNKTIQNIISIWRIICFSFITTSLGFLLINNGWEKINEDRVLLKGNDYIKKSIIIEVMGITLPTSLIMINPKQIEINLLNNLPIQETKSRRRILPPSIYIEILERKPVAYASKRGPKGIERGMIDENAYWIPISNQIHPDQKFPKITLHVDGWREKHRKWISFIYKNKGKLNSPLKKIILRPNGDISLETENFELIHFGSIHSELEEKFIALVQLTDSLPKKYIKDGKTIIDLKNPSRPNLQLK